MVADRVVRRAATHAGRVPAYVRRARPSSSSMRSSWLYLHDAIGAARRAGLDLARAGADRQVGDRRVFGLARAVRDDRRVAGVARHRDGVERFGDRADLIQLDQQRVADAFVDALLRESPGW